MKKILNQWTILGFFVLVLIVYFFMTRNPQNTTNDNKENFTPITPVTNAPGDATNVATKGSGQCSINGGGCSDNKNLLPILNPLFNMRELCKQSILLEDHLFQTRKRCDDCVTKHAMGIEALAEEAITLDKENKYCKVLQSLPDKIRNLIKDLNKCPPEEYNRIGQGFRNIRKSLMPICKNSF